MSGSRAAARSEIGTRGRTGRQGAAARLWAPVTAFTLALAAVGGLAACGGGSSATTSGAAGAGGGAGNNPAPVATSGSSGAVTPAASATGSGKGSGFGAGLNSILPSAGSTGATGAGSPAGTVVGSPSPQPAATKTTTVSSTVMFSSPSKNVACYMANDPVYTRCDIAQHNWASPPRPASCDLDYGNGLFLDDKNAAGISCAGDTVLGQTRILGYGEALRLGSQVCTSSPAGMRCTNLANGHGFVLAKEGYQLF